MMDESWYRCASKHERGEADAPDNTLPSNKTCFEEKEDQTDITRIEAGKVSGGLDDILRSRHRSSSPTGLKVSTGSIPVIYQDKDYNPSLEILRSFSSESMKPINKSQSTDPDFDRGLRSATASITTDSVPIPRRNLTEEFEELYTKPCEPWKNNVADSPQVKNLKNMGGKSNAGSSNVISPTGVAELETTTTVSVASSETTLSSPPTETSNLVTPIKPDRTTTRDGSKEEQKSFQFRLHPQLQREMSDALVRRVCFYSIIHDINKEATTMASNDDSGYNRNPDEINEKYDPLIMAINGDTRSEFTGSTSMVSVALIDEEEWLLEAINTRNPDEIRSIKACPPTFLQAMGEREYENPLTSLSNGSRTQLWKPSRSWWEAKSGKNPWIEPNSHNKRWRYLWPLIHYHKFLAKCIKKLKRNSICVKNSVSPVAVFLREEVCAVSDHLALVSLFDSDEWMCCLKHFKGWVESSEDAARNSRELVSKLKLRSLHEPGDVDSTLLRHQIDEQLLRAIVNAREQLTGKEISKDEKRTSKEPMRRRERNQNGSVKSSFSISSVDAEAPCPRQISTQHSKGRSGHQRNWHGYPHNGWWQNSWHHHHHPYPYGDEGSVHSSLSCDTSYSHGFMNGYNHGAVPAHPQFYPSMMYAQHHAMHGGPHGSYPSSAVPPNPPVYPGDPYDPYDPQHLDLTGWMRHSSVDQYHSPESPALTGTPVDHDESQNSALVADQEPTALPETVQNPDESFDTHRTPYKPNSTHVPMSPYWAHLQDPATLAMMGLSSPPGSVPPTPHRNADSSFVQEDISLVEMKNNMNAQPLLLRQQYYGYGYGSREGYAPPSPATQFMMSPQESFAYSYGYGFSPSRRSTSQAKLLNTSISEEEIDALHGMQEGANTDPEPTNPSARIEHDQDGRDETADVSEG
mmetsp:Transcript_25394/g.59830  ORF Transcript_25394/g.59830 Transcript_25394/m.59830 type:complete len:915 (-) Transcript_25394:2718-5462(-)